MKSLSIAALLNLATAYKNEKYNAFKIVADKKWCAERGEALRGDQYKDPLPAFTTIMTMEECKDSKYFYTHTSDVSFCCLATFDISKANDSPSVVLYEMIKEPSCDDQIKDEVDGAILAAENRCTEVARVAEEDAKKKLADAEKNATDLEKAAEDALKKAAELTKVANEAKEGKEKALADAAEAEKAAAAAVKAAGNAEKEAKLEAEKELLAAVQKAKEEAVSEISQLKRDNLRIKQACIDRPDTDSNTGGKGRQNRNNIQHVDVSMSKVSQVTYLV